MRGDMTSEEYIMKFMQTIGSLDSMVRSLRDELALLREKDAEHGIERKRLMALIEDKDISSLTKQMAQLLGKVDALTKALEGREKDYFGML